MNKHIEHFRSVAAEYDDLAKNGVYATLAPHNRGGRKSEYVNAVFDAAVLPPLVEGGSCSHVLDFGCGTGSFTRVMAQYCQQVTGVDVSGKMVETAKQYCGGLSNVHFQLIDGETLPFESGFFDRVVARESLCYVPDEMLGDVLAEIVRVLKPGGRLLWLEQVSNDPFWQRHAGAPNLVKRPPHVLRELLQQRGMTLLEERVARVPRFPWIYPIWFGLAPRAWIPTMARWEVAWHRKFNVHPRRWWDALLIAERPVHD